MKWPWEGPLGRAPTGRAPMGRAPMGGSLIKGKRACRKGPNCKDSNGKSSNIKGQLGRIPMERLAIGWTAIYILFISKKVLHVDLADIKIIKTNL